MSCRIYIGTSGWQYGDWADGKFYPPNLKERQWLEFYSRHFATVEINSTFYHQMQNSVFIKWREIVPQKFLFSVKLSRFLTHVKKLNDPTVPWQNFIANAQGLKEKLGPVLVQLPPRLKSNPVKLRNLLRLAGKKFRLALEFRDNSWFNEAVYAILKKYNASLVFSDMLEWPTPKIITGDFIYIRRHGPADRYSSRYTGKQMIVLADKIKIWTKKVKYIFVYFNNDTEGYALKNAEELKKLLGLK